MDTFAFYTFLLQAVTFPLFILFLVYYNFKLMFSRSRRKKTGQASVSKTAMPSIPVLKPLTCNNCGGSVSLRNNDQKCRYCAAPVTIPAEYVEVGKLRKDLAARLYKAQRYWRRADFFTSPVLRWSIRLLYLWLLAAMIICFAHENFFVQKTYGLLGEDERRLQSFIVIGLCTTLVWTILLMVMAGSISRKARKVLPVMEPAHLEKTEQLGCGTCGNQLHFEKGSLVELCDYCGVETYRAKMAWQTKKQVNASRDQASFSLIGAMGSYQEAVEEIWSGPSILIFIFLVLPFFMIVLPMMVWNFIKAHVLLVTLLSLGLLLLFFLFYRGEKKKTV